MDSPSIEAPSGYSEANFAGWYTDGAAWDFSANPVNSNLTLSAWYQSHVSIDVYDEQSGASPIDSVYAYYSFANPGLDNYILSMPSTPVDPSGNDREFLGWYYIDNNSEEQIVLSGTYPDTGIYSHIIPDYVTRIYAGWGEPQPTPTSLEITIPNSLPLAATGWTVASDSTTGSITSYKPYIDAQYYTQVANIYNAVDAGECDTVLLTQGENLFTFNQCAANDDVLTLRDNGNNFQISLDLADNSCGEGNVPVSDVEGWLQKDEEPIADGTFVFNEDVATTVWDAAANNIADNTIVILAQINQPNAIYTCDAYTQSQTPGQDLTLTFSTNDGDSMELQLIFVEEDATGHWELNQGQKSGFDNLDITFN